METRSPSSRLAALAFWAALTAWVAFLRAPSYADAFFDPDVAATAYSARLFAHGSCIYPDAVETKPPGSYAALALLLAIGRDMAGVHLLMVLYHLAVAALLARLVARRGGVRAGRLAALAYGSFSAMGFVDGYAPNFETWTLLPLAATAAVIDGEDGGATWRPLAAGALAGTGILMKQQALVVAGALGLTLLLPRGTARGRGVRAAGPALFALGVLVPWAIALGYFAAKGCVGPLVAALSPARNATYVASNLPGEILARAGRFFGTFARHAWFLVAGAAAGTVVLARSPKERSLLVPAGAWLGGALAATWAGTMFFPHYAVLLLPPLAALAGPGMDAAARAARRRPARIGLTVLAALLVAGNLHREVRLSWVAARDLVRTGRVESRELFRLNASYGPDWNDYACGLLNLEYELYARMAGGYIRERSAPSEKILVYDYLPSVYWFADRRAPTRHHMNFDVARELPDDYGRWFSRETEALRRNREELLRDLTARPPRFIVRARWERPRVWDSALNPRNVYGDPMNYALWRTPLFPDLKDFVDRHYRPAKDAPDTPLSILERDDSTFP